MSQSAISMQYTGGPRISLSLRIAVSCSGAAASRPIRCGVTNRSMAIAASERASAPATPVIPPSVSTSTTVMKKLRWISLRPHAGLKSSGRGRSRTRDRTLVIRVSRPAEVCTDNILFPTTPYQILIAVLYIGGRDRLMDPRRHRRPPARGDIGARALGGRPSRARAAAPTSPALADASLEVDVGLGAEAVVVEVPEHG